MKLLTLLILILFPIFANAQIVIGAKTTGQPTLLIQDFNTFDLTYPDIFGIERYGFGKGSTEITDRLGFLAENRSGIFLGTGNVLKLGIEPVSGTIDYHDRLGYNWQPGISAGIRETFSGIGFYIAPRTGLSYEKSNNDTFIGSVIEVQIFTVRVSYWQNKYVHSPNLEIFDVNLSNKVDVQKKNDIYSIGYRIDL